MKSNQKLESFPSQCLESKSVILHQQMIAQVKNKLIWNKKFIKRCSSEKETWQIE